MGQTYGRLTIIGEIERIKKGKVNTPFVKCRCDCGKECTINYWLLKDGRTKSCGCLRGNSFRLKTKSNAPKIGARFGNLKVISNEIVYKNYNAYILCRCVCGKDKLAKIYDLKKGLRTTCGTWSCRPHNKNPENQLLSAIYRSYKRGASQRGIEFVISFEEFSELVMQPCHYCKEEKTNCKEIKRIQLGNYKVLYTGIDRKDSKLGYTKSNCLPCCSVCNTCKMHYNYDDFINRANKIAKIHPRDISNWKSTELNKPFQKTK